VIGIEYSIRISSYYNRQHVFIVHRSSFIDETSHLDAWNERASETRWRGTVMHEYAAKIHRIIHIYFGTRGGGDGAIGGESFVGAFKALN